MTLTVGSLCSGYGGLDCAVEAVFGARTVWHAETEPGPAAVLAARWPTVPNLGDITAVDWTAVEPVDVLAAGWPCQPFSTAGRRKGADDDRHLWPHVLAAVRALAPRGLRWLVGENVAGHVSLGLDAVLGDLAEIGWDAEWGCLPASAVGAPHRRERLFIVAAAADASGGQPERRGGSGDLGGTSAADEGAGRERQRVRDTAGDRRTTAPDADGGRLSREPERHGQSERPDVLAPRRDHADGRRPIAADAADGPGGRERPREDARARGWGVYAPAIARWERVLGRSAPEAVDGRGRLSPQFVEFLMGLPNGWVTNVPMSRSAALKALGNGVVPAQAEWALTVLLERLHAAEAMAA